MDPVVFGGGMINEVSFESSSWSEIPYKFEAGTPNIAGAVGLMAAIEYLQKIGMDKKSIVWSTKDYKMQFERWSISKLKKEIRQKR